MLFIGVLHGMPAQYSGHAVHFSQLHSMMGCKVVSLTSQRIMKDGEDVQCAIAGLASLKVCTSSLHITDKPKYSVTTAICDCVQLKACPCAAAVWQGKALELTFTSCFTT